MNHFAHHPRPSISVQGAGSGALLRIGARPTLALLVSFYIAAMLWNFRFIVGEHFGYMGFWFSIGSTTQIAITMLVALAPIIWLPVHDREPSTLVYSLLYLVVYVPSCVIPSFTEDASPITVVRLQGLMLLSLATSVAVHRALRFRLQDCRLPWITYWLLVLGFTCLTSIWTAKVFGIQIRALSLMEMYAVREGHIETLQGSNRLLVYLVAWQANVVNPLALAFSLVTRRYWLAAGVTLLQLWLFSLSGYKTYVLALPLVAFLVAASGAKRPGALIVILSTAMFTLVVGSSMLDYLSQGFEFSSVFVRRLLFTPGRQTFWYYEFFSDGPKMMLSHSILSRFIECPYEAPPPQLIGEKHFHSYNAYANGNLWADAYANFGAAGMICYSVALGVLTKLYDNVSKGVDRRVAVAALAMPAISLCNSALLTTLLTHGMGLSLLLLLLFPDYVSRGGRTPVRHDGGH